MDDAKMQNSVRYSGNEFQADGPAIVKARLTKELNCYIPAGRVVA